MDNGTIAVHSIYCRGDRARFEILMVSVFIRSYFHSILFLSVNPYPTQGQNIKSQNEQFTGMILIKKKKKLYKIILSIDTYEYKTIVQHYNLYDLQRLA